MRGSRAISIRQGPPREARPGPRDSADARTGPRPAVVWSRPRSGYAPRADRVVPRRGDRRHRSRPGVRRAAPLRSGCGRCRQGGADRGGARAGSRAGEDGIALPPARTGPEAPADLCAPSTMDRGRRADGSAVGLGFAQMPAARTPDRDPASRPVRDLARDDERPVPSAGRPPHRIASGPHPRSPGGTSREPRMPDGESGDPADRSVTITPARCAWGSGRRSKPGRAGPTDARRRDAQARHREAARSPALRPGRTCGSATPRSVPHACGTPFDMAMTAGAEPPAGSSARLARRPSPAAARPGAHAPRAAGPVRAAWVVLATARALAAMIPVPLARGPAPSAWSRPKRAATAATRAPYHRASRLRPEPAPEARCMSPPPC